MLLNTKKTPGIPWGFSMLSSQIFDRAEILVTMAKISVSEIQIRIFCNGNATVTKDPTQGINIHAVHQTPFGEVVSQGVRGVGLLDTSSAQIPLEARFKGVDIQRKSGFFGKQEPAAGVSILELEPTVQTFCCLNRKEDIACASALGIFGR